MCGNNDKKRFSDAPQITRALENVKVGLQTVNIALKCDFFMRPSGSEFILNIRMHLFLCEFLSALPCNEDTPFRELQEKKPNVN